jgi:alkaline phosphatase D
VNDGGMPPVPVTVAWEVGTDERLGRIVRRGTAVARPEWGHAVHVEVQGLDPDRWYWYRFRAGDAASRIGRTRTLPPPDAPRSRMRFAFASCQHWEQGYFSAYRHMLADDLDLVVHLGDYVYESGPPGGGVRRHEGPEPVSLAGYRNRHALYKLDPDLQAAHAAYPWITTWDDHEVDNDYAGDQSQDRDDPAAFLARRAAAYQAYYEHLPLRRLARPDGPDAQLYQRVAFGSLAEFHVLDTRQYRSDQACGENRSGGGNQVEDCAERLDPRRTMLGTAQERWLSSGLDRGTARWTVLAQPMLMAELRQRSPSGGEAYWTDGWDGYAPARSRILDRLARRTAGVRPTNAVVIGGDIHSFWVTDLKADFRDPASPTVASEFVGTSISSPGVPYETFAAFLADNPHVRYFESRFRGYVRCEVTPARWRADLRVVESVRDRQAPARTLASFVVEDGRPGAVPA